MQIGESSSGGAEHLVEQTGRRWRRLPVLVRRPVQLLVLCAVGVASAQISAAIVEASRGADNLHPHKIVAGPELILVLIGTSKCGYSHSPGAQNSFQRIVRSVEQQARERGSKTFSVVGVSLDWDAEVGLKYLREMGPFDEMIAGRFVLGTGVDQYIRPAGTPMAVPQILVYERVVRASEDSLAGQKELMLSLVGLEAIDAWATSGARLAKTTSGIK